MSGKGENIIQSVRSSTLSEDETVDTRKRELSVVTSYNWLDRSEPTIMVPGSPALWDPLPSSIKLSPDTGLVYIDQNAFRHPECPLEPLFRAVYSKDPRFDASDIDLVTDRNNLRKLLKFVTGTPEDFRIKVERINGTTLFTRCEEKTSDFIRSGQFRGFGHQFEKNYTTWSADTKGSTGHHRIIRYKFGGLKCLVRFEVDACLEFGKAAPDKDDLTELVAGIALKEEETSAIHTRKGGNLVSQDSIAEIKTRAAHRQIDMLDVLPQLWFSDTQWLITAYHHGGRFNNVKKSNVEFELDSWERSNVRNLKKLAGLLRTIINAAKDAEDGRCSIVCQGTQLKILEDSEVKYQLPADLRKKFKPDTAEE
ncbi:geranylgeranyl pyrophosphate synthetase [Pyronema omphalodes]|nr:geranylgeranyl pyrophosphate synthetase [Pyronema omphalodes]